MRRLIILILLWFVLFVFSPVLLIGTTPLEASNRINESPLVLITLRVENVSVMYEKLLPLKEYLEQATSHKLTLKVAQNYQEAIEHIGTGKAHIAYLDPSAYCEARDKYNIVPIAKAINAGSPTYKSVIVTRHDSPINKIIEVKGKKLALGNKSSSSSYLIPAVMLKEVGISLSDFSSVGYLEEEDRIALSVLTGRYDIGGMSESVANKYVRDGLKIIKKSESIPQFTISAYNGIPSHLRDDIQTALMSINKTKYPDLTRAMKDIEGFAPAEDRDFDVVRVMIRNLTGKNYLKYGGNTKKVAILPLYSAITLYDRFDPLMRHLSMKTGYEFKLVIPKDFETFFETIAKGKVEYSYSNPYIYTQLADNGYLDAFTNTIKPPTGDVFRGIIIVHKDSNIRLLEDLRNKNVMIVSPLSAAGFLAQKLYLLENGIDVNKDMNMIDGKRQEEVMLNVYRKTVDAGFVRESAPIVLKEEIDLKKIRILAMTPYIPNWPFASTRKADHHITERVQKYLLELEDDSVLSAAQITGFKAANNEDFDSLRKWIKKHDRK
jgi:phosphate/phosphite/phosphonate ABC transporter binding protein